MEYLMTYGWALLVVMIVLGVLFYMGVFTPSTPSGCSFGAGEVAYVGSSLTTGGAMRIALRNGLNTVTAAQVETVATSKDVAANVIVANTSTGTSEMAGALAASQDFWLYIADPTGDPATAGKPYSLTVSIAYTDDGGLAHTMTGDCTIMSE